jgi:hypothetical protein
VPIRRNGVNPAFFSMRGWTLDQLWDLNYNKKVSDGGEGKDKPEGRLVAYPITALSVKDVVLTSDQSQDQMNYINSQIKAGGCAGYATFFLGGSYSQGSEKRDFKSHAEGGALHIPGIQLIGFINNLVPKCPNPNPAIKPEQFVGSA